MFQDGRPRFPDGDQRASELISWVCRHRVCTDNALRFGENTGRIAGEFHQDGIGECERRSVNFWGGVNLREESCDESTSQFVHFL